ncbi:MAG: AraC family transcriptional regulator [Oscillatoriophycideae cyanobacterium NC_groundwater_1537_Pr4_S-0.65um_50_18]|nr:AraC family transcriptional regulator [Oscillatoriophycideae cyanobacterium NC_groundwater_1537_Pr4_S-0.65um_50_18]
MKTRSPLQSTEQVKFWRDPALNNIEMLRATYVTHSFSRHTHEGYAIGVIDAGVEEFTYQGATHQATAGSLVIVHPGEVHTGHAGTAEGWQYRMLYPDVTLLQRAIAELQDNAATIPYFPNPVIQDSPLAGQVRRLHMALEATESQLERESRFLWTLAQLILRYADRRSATFLLGQEHQAVLRVRDYLKAYFADSISLDQLAQIAHLKPLRLLRVFQRETGLPPHAYLVQLRVQQAKLMLSSGKAIAQVAFETGFTDQSHLNRHFKRLVGMTPGQYAIGCRLS